MKAVNYKGKHFILQDNDTITDEDDVLDWIDIDIIITENWVLKKHVTDCLYYGIPAYIGKDKELTKRIDYIIEEYDKLQTT